MAAGTYRAIERDVRGTVPVPVCAEEDLFMGFLLGKIPVCALIYRLTIVKTVGVITPFSKASRDADHTFTHTRSLFFLFLFQ